MDTDFLPFVYLDEHAVPFLHHFRYSRPDISGFGSNLVASQAGFCLEYLVPQPLVNSTFSTLVIEIPGSAPHRFHGSFSFLEPDYYPLLDCGDVLHRESIYGSGTPNAVVHPEVLELAAQLPGPVLDFGCGRGIVVSTLRQLGVEATGLELYSEGMRTLLAAENTASVVLYDGTFPSPFADGSFRSVFCSEVLEHLPDYESAIKEIARLAAYRAVFTVPDTSAIALGFRHGLVPWHLLESTHVNFFTQESLYRALKPYYSRIEFGRISESLINDTRYHVSLVAVCSKFANF